MVALVCVSDGTPTPSLLWMKEGAALPMDTHFTLLNHNSTLQVSQIQVDHTGRYTCVARNQAGEARRHFNLKVLGKNKREKKKRKIQAGTIQSNNEVCLCPVSP